MYLTKEETIDMHLSNQQSLHHQEEMQCEHDNIMMETYWMSIMRDECKDVSWGNPHE